MIAGATLLGLLSYQYYIVGGHAPKSAVFGSSSRALVQGHWDFGDGRKTLVDRVYLEPANSMLYYVNVMLGNGGYVNEG